MKPFRPSVMLRRISCLCVALAVCAATMSGNALAQPARGPDPGAKGPMEVGVVALERQLVPYIVTVPGRAAAVDQVEIRPRVDGLIAEIPFQSGKRVRTGDLLFSIEDDVYQAEVLAAKAALESAKAAVAAAQSKVSRYLKILETGVTATEYETAESDLAASRSSQSAAEASLRLARINLERTQIHAPINGVVDIATVSSGDVVTANQTDALTTVTRLDPIYVDIAESSARILRNRERIDSGIISRGKEVELHLTLESGTRYEAVGEVVAPGVQVSTTTGTRTIRVRFPNPDRLILPGQFLRVDVTLGTVDAVLVPQGAAQRTADGTLMAYIAQAGRAQRVQLTETGSYQNAWVVTEGVSVGDLLIVDGLSNLKAMASIQPVPVQISDTGVVTMITKPAPGE